MLHYGVWETIKNVRKAVSDVNEVVYLGNGDKCVHGASKSYPYLV